MVDLELACLTSFQQVSLSSCSHIFISTASSTTLGVFVAQVSNLASEAIEIHYSKVIDSKLPIKAKLLVRQQVSDHFKC
jgi:hypothetical protein